METGCDDLLREADKLHAGVSCGCLASSSPILVSRTANRLSVPLRLYSKPWFLGAPGAQQHQASQTFRADRAHPLGAESIVARSFSQVSTLRPPRVRIVVASIEP